MFFEIGQKQSGFEKKFDRINQMKSTCPEKHFEDKNSLNN